MNWSNNVQRRWIRLGRWRWKHFLSICTGQRNCLKWVKNVNKDYTVKSFFISFPEKFCQILPIHKNKTLQNLQKSAIRENKILKICLPKVINGYVETILFYVYSMNKTCIHCTCIHPILRGPTKWKLHLFHAGKKKIIDIQISACTHLSTILWNHPSHFLWIAKYIISV